MRTRILFLVFFLLCFTVYVSGQVNNDVFNADHSAFAEDTAMLSIGLRSTSFFKNNEYFNPFAEGYTLGGFWLQPTISYAPLKQFKLRGGLHLLAYAGKEEYLQCIPLLSAQYRPTPHLNLTIGRLYGALEHNLPEPLYAFDRYLYDNVEQGLQVLIKHQHYEADNWINWEKFIWYGNPEQEQFTFGSSHLFKWGKPLKQWSIPVRLMTTHKGGQINNNSQPVQTLANSQTGIQWKVFSSKKKLPYWELQLQAFSFHDLSQNKQLPYQHGRAAYLRLAKRFAWQKQYLTLSTGLWYGDYFSAGRGEALFYSYNSLKPYYQENERAILTAKANFNILIAPYVDFIMRLETYSDLYNQTTDYAIGVYLLLDQQFFIK